MINKIYILLKKKKKRKTTQFYYPPSLPRNFPLDLTHTWYLYTCYIFVETRKGFHLLYSKNCSLFKEQRFSSEIENRDRDRDRSSYRSSFRLRGKERRRGEEGRRGRGGSTNSVSGKIRLKVIKAARRRAGRSGNGRANERVSGSRLKGSHPLRPTLPLSPSSLHQSQLYPLSPQLSFIITARDFIPALDVAGPGPSAAFRSGRSTGIR